MKQVFVCAAFLFLSVGAKAQAVSSDALPLAPVSVAPSAASTDSASLVAVETAPPTPEAGAFRPSAEADPSSTAADQRPSVYGVIKTYNWQATAGYTFFRFYIVPGVTRNLNGLNLGLAYYPGGHWIGGEGEFIGAWGALAGETAKYVQAMGGPRFRWDAGRGLEIWGHGLVGGANFLPQTIFGSQGAFAYEVGGGVDLNVHQKRWSYRASANLVGTRFFSTYQYSPNVSVGIVFKF